MFLRFPLVADYEHTLDSDIADVKNSASGKLAGHITAALFLQKFVDAEIKKKYGLKYMHLDVAGPVWTEKTLAECSQPGATGFGVRSLAEFVERANPFQLNL